MNLQQILWWLSIGSECAALVALLVRRLSPRYYRFAAYLGFGVIRGVGLHFAGSPRGSKTYAISWLITEPVLLTALVAATVEIVSKVPEHYRGFGNFGRQKLRRLLEWAVAIALLSTVVDAWGSAWTWTIPGFLRGMFSLHRITTSIMALYLLFVAIFVSRLRVSVRRNLLVHSRLFACYLCLQTLVMLWQGVLAGGQGTNASNAALTGGSAVLFLLWAALLTRYGETATPALPLSQDEIQANQQRERDLENVIRRYSDRPLG